MLLHPHDEMIFNTPTTTDVFGEEVFGEERHEICVHKEVIVKGSFIILSSYSKYGKSIEMCFNICYYVHLW